MIVQRFAKWTREASAKERCEAATMLAEALVFGGATGSDRDTIVASLTLLLDDPAPAVRLAMAKVLGAGRNVPEALVFALASDVAPVAAEIAGRSMHLGEGALVDLAAVGSAAARRAIAERPVVPLPVAAVIAEIGEAEAVLALCRNDGAAIAEASFTRLSERFGDEGPIREALLGRSDLPPAVRHRLMLAVRDALAASGLLSNLYGEKRAGAVAFAAGERGTNVLAEQLTDRQMPEFGDYLRRSGAVTPSLLVRVVAVGNVELFATLLASLSGRSERRVGAIVAAGKSSALRALVLDCGLPEGLATLFAEAIALWRAIARGERALRPAAVPALLLGRLSATGAARTVPAEALTLLRQLAGEAERDAARESVRAAA
ncbi:DUF2336 domain-containing protein [Jiella sonneratiae]|uniref:DUF2336 domain-containing protein n=1 Tax=Jiella sonneratiae TaxID=2816856 RepID=A0ABS3IYZ7_9HYPH|nr:DUF2336 domain-containing protein [Jiella sonneratiae]MBO0902640.1 DUF2336 domain-containing protein [Jiella sonneratiae]